MLNEEENTATTPALLLNIKFAVIHERRDNRHLSYHAQQHRCLFSQQWLNM